VKERGHRRLKRWFLDLKLRNKLVLVYSFVVMVPAMTVGLVSYAISGNALQNEVVTFLQTDLGKSAERIDMKLAAWQDKSRIVSVSDTVMVLMPNHYDNDYPEVFTFYRKLNSLFTVALSSETAEPQPLRSRMEIFTFNETLLLDDCYIRSANRFVSDRIRAGELTQELLDTYPSTFWLPPSPSEDGSGVLTLCRKLFTSNYRELSGLICVHISTAELEDELSRMNLPEGGWVIYLDASDRPVFSIAASGDSLEKARGIGAGDLDPVDRDGALYFMQRTPVNGGRLVLSYPKSHLQSKIFGILGITQVVVVLSLILAFLVSILIARLITRRLTRFVESVSRVADNEKSSIVPMFGDDEIGKLNREFIHLVDQIDRMQQERYRTSIQKRTLELDLLQSQVNPHFLYNIMASIKWAGNGIVGEIVDSIVRFFRMSLNNGREIIEISDEIGIIHEYVKIQQFTYDDSFEVEFDIAPDILSLCMIKLLLQPIVENAILHGINGKKDGQGRIRISGSRQGEDVRFDVSDNGLGMDPETLLRLCDENTARKSDSGFGLRNVRERIRLVYGDPYGITIESQLGIGTRITLRIPGCNRGELTEMLGRFV
jgi:two-component system sensor histidine kinase YesM